jgi:hypothetical protein
LKDAPIILLDSDDESKSPPKSIRASQATVPDDDDELFARARQIMTAMDQDMQEDLY